MTYTENLAPDDPRQEIFRLRAKVLDGESLTDKECRQAIELLRQHRRGKAAPQSRAKKTEGSAPAAKAAKRKNPEVETKLDDLLGGSE